VGEVKQIRSSGRGGLHRGERDLLTGGRADLVRGAVAVPGDKPGGVVVGDEVLQPARSGPTAATCKVAPMSIAAAWGWTGGIARFRLDRLALLTRPSSAADGGDGLRDRSVS
jgi:hypothetical protein